MITATELRNSVLSRSARGYKVNEVDDLLEEAALSIDRLTKENAELLQKLGVLADKIQEYRADEDNLRSALLIAQRSADQIMREATDNKNQTIAGAQSEADSLLSAAKEKSDEMLRDARAKSVAIVNETKEKAIMVIAEAKESAGKTMSDAQNRASQMLSDATEGCHNERMQLEYLKKQAADFRSALIQMYRDQFEILKRGPVLTNATIDGKEHINAPIQQDSYRSVSTPPQRVSTPVISVDDAPVVPKQEYSSAVLPVSAPAEPSKPEFTEPEDIPLPIAKKPVDDSDDTTDTDKSTNITGGFKITPPVRPEGKFTNVKFGEDYDISADEDDDEE